MIHPFREGNGRTQRIYIEQLCLNRVLNQWTYHSRLYAAAKDASVRSANASNDMLEKLISNCLVEK